MQAVAQKADHSASAVAATLVPDLARQAARHDADDSFVCENMDLLRQSGLIAAGEIGRAHV